MLFNYIFIQCIFLQQKIPTFKLHFLLISNAQEFQIKQHLFRSNHCFPAFKFQTAKLLFNNKDTMYYWKKVLFQAEKSEKYILIICLKQKEIQSKTDGPFLQPASYDTHEVSSFLSKIIEIRRQFSCKKNINFNNVSEFQRWDFVFTLRVMPKKEL